MPKSEAAPTRSQLSKKAVSRAKGSISTPIRLWESNTLRAPPVSCPSCQRVLSDQQVECEFCPFCHEELPVMQVPSYEPELDGQAEVGRRISIDESALEVAEWMAEEFRKDGQLSQRRAANEILHRFGEQFVYKNDNGNRAIHRQVLDAFRALTGSEAVWDKDYFQWRCRRPTDPHSGRSV